MKKILILFLTTVIFTLLFSVSIFADCKEKTIDKQSSNVQSEVLKEGKVLKPIERIYITRGEFIAQIYKVLGIKICYFVAPDIHQVFTDVSSDYKYGNQIYDMHTVGIIDDKELFRPNDKLTRAEAVHYIVRAYNYKQKETQIGEEVEPTSGKLVNRGYLKDISQAQKIGIIHKEKVSAFNKLITRAEAATLIKRMEKLIIKENSKEEPKVVIEPTYSFTKEGLKLTAEVINKGKENVTIDFSSGHEIDFILLDGSGKEIYNSSSDTMFIQIVSKVKLKPGESKVYSVDVLCSDNKEAVNNACAVKVKFYGTVNGKGFEDQTVRFIRFLGPPVKSE